MRPLTMSIDEYQLTWFRGFIGFMLWKKWDLTLYFGYCFERGGVEATFNFESPCRSVDLKLWPFWISLGWWNSPYSYGADEEIQE